MTHSGSLSSSSAVALDLARVRAQFPALDRRHQGRPVAYFDGPGGTQVPRLVVDAMTDYLLHHNANTHWHYPTSAETDAILASARQALADFLHASPEEIAFGANMTSLTFHLARALARGWAPGDEVIVTELDHHANVDSWRAAAADRGLTVRTVRVLSPSGELDFDDLAAAFTPRTKLLAIGAASNAIGTMVDLTRAIGLARSAGALVFVDAVHAAPHALVDVRDLDCDFLGCSTYKFYGPHLGVLYGKRARIEALDVPKLRPAPDEAPERLETGTQNHEGIAGAAAAVDFLASLPVTGGHLPDAHLPDAPGAGVLLVGEPGSLETAPEPIASAGRHLGASAGVGAATPSRRAALVRAFAAIHEEGERRFAQLWDGLASVPGVTLYGRPPRPSRAELAARSPTVAFTVEGHSSDQVAEALAARAVFVSNGNFYAQTLLERLGRTGGGGLVRAGCAVYTTEEEVDRLIEGVRALAR